jgi:hypothetical protein
MAAALGRAPLVRHAQYGGDDRQRRDGYASDYPHGESHFPESVSIVLDWVMDAERKRKLLWDNAIRFYARAPL